MADLRPDQIEAIVRQVLTNVGGKSESAQTAQTAPEVKTSSYSSTEYNGRKLIGIFTDMNDAIAAAQEGYKAVRSMTVEERSRNISGNGC